MRDFAVSCTFSAFMAAGAFASCPIPFSPASLIPASGTYSSVLVDFDRDGRLDLAMVNSATHTVSVRIAVHAPSPYGTFNPVVTYPVGTSPRHIASADFNNDGIADLAITNGSTLNVSVLRGNGDGTFQTAVNYNVGTQPQSILARDMNQDGKVDLVVPYFNNVGILRGNGDGTFQSVISYPVTNTTWVTSGDFNHDGIPDLAGTCYDATVLWVMLGQGGGNFAPLVSYSTAFGPWGIASADVNGDGRDDIVCSNYVSNSVSVFISNADGSLQPRTSFNASVVHPTAVALVDLNADGHPDIVTAGFNGTGISVLRNTGAGAFTSASLTSAGTPSYGVAVGDINNDGTPDLSIANQNGGVALLFNRYCAADFNCDGTSDFFDYLDFVDRFSRNDSSADFNADGIIDFFDYLDFVQQFQILCP